MGIKACPYCAEEIREEAVICKHCKSNLKETGAPKEAGVTVAKSDKAFGAAMGFFGGLGCGIWLIIFGLLISLTGIGAIIGIPLALGSAHALYCSSDGLGTGFGTMSALH